MGGLHRYLDSLGFHLPLAQLIFAFPFYVIALAMIAKLSYHFLERPSIRLGKYFGGYKSFVAFNE